MIYESVFVPLSDYFRFVTMKTTITIFLAIFLLSACGSGTLRGKPSSATATNASSIRFVEPKYYTYSILATYPHATTSYTQGLQYVDGILWEGTGQNGKSVLQQVDLATGKTKVIARLPQSEFGEGITLLNGKVYQLTWQSNKAYVYDATTGQKLQEFRYAGEGWGLTTDGKQLYLSDGTAKIYPTDPETFRRGKPITVTLRGEPVYYLNELEWIEGRIWANIYTTDHIAIINPTTGVVEGLIDLTGLLPAGEITPQTDVLNGIAYDAATKRIFVTGKNWSRLFEIAISEK